MSLEAGPSLERGVAVVHPPSSAPISIARIVSDVVDAIQSQGGVIQAQSVPVPTITPIPPAPALTLATSNSNLVPATLTHVSFPLNAAPAALHTARARTLLLGDGQEHQQMCKTF